MSGRDPEACQRLAKAVDDAREELGLSKHDLARLSAVSRPTVWLLINHAVVPARESGLDRIGSALGWEPGTCAAILEGRMDVAQRTVAPSRAALLVAEQLDELAASAASAAEAAEWSAGRLRQIEAQISAAARLVLRSP
jgi:hypothetical protein